MSTPPPDPALHLPLLFGDAEVRSTHDGKVESEVLRLFEHSRTRLLRYLYSIGLRDHDAEEVVQEVFLAVFQHLRQGRDQGNLRGWLFRVTHNLGLKRRVAERRTASPSDESIFRLQVDPQPDPEQQVGARQRQKKLLAVLQALPEQDRCCLHMRAEGLRYREIAQSLGISLGSVAQSLARSLKRLQNADGKI